MRRGVEQVPTSHAGEPAWELPFLELSEPGHLAARGLG
jgi:hypothetical protein